MIRTTQPAQACVSRNLRLMASMAALTLFAATAVSVRAQSPVQSAPPAQLQAQLQPNATPLFHSALVAPVNIFAFTPDSSSSSSSSSSTDSSSSSDALAAERFSFTGEDAGGQPPPRRSYGRRPRYSDSSHNADGSNKYTFEFGVGLTVPTGTTNNTFRPSYKFQVGGGRNFNKTFGLLAQFDWDNFGIQTGTLNTLLATYQNLCGTGCTGSQIQQVGGSMHVWSFSLNPVINFAQSDKTGAYVVGGVGFYHKATNITTPATGTYCDYYYGCYQYQANASIDKYVSNAPGFNGGVGVTYRASRFNDVKFFAEVRYVYVFNSTRPYYDGTTGTKLSPTYFNVFPQNSARTSYLPITFGVRF